MGPSRALAAIKGFRFHLPLQPMKCNSEGHLCREHALAVLQCPCLLTLFKATGSQLGEDPSVVSPQCSSWPHTQPTVLPSPIPLLVLMNFPKNAYLSHSIRCHMQTVQKVTYNLGHRPAHELAQQCFLLSVVYSHNLNSNRKI